ncbi:ubiquitinyl hydrolase 1 [Caenorhabditis elegans]|uniref:ubiquitinyl hydrolase 1 n=3 Tax=Caenorhabditis elegans TaxID=6239 RepID=Q7JMS4_CAEEL|nr:USP domain-containing protein [Caenorhabditis elegans]CAF31477.2 USP domain-containing protein [Caenorhabditis elegans]|eukprot:NP_001255045.1 CYLinDromatosis (human disease gene) homolog [Caenorhabditis elegans]
MPGEFAKFPEQSAGSHQFRNPLDELTGSNTITNLTAHDFDYFTQSEKNSNLYTSENTSNSNRLNLNQNIPVGTLIDGFELINEASGSGFLDDQLVDVSDYSRDRTTKLDRNRNSPELIVALLQRKVQGIRFSSNYGREEEPCVIEIPPGTMVREMADDDWKMSELKEWFTKSRASSHLRDGLAMPMEELDCTPLICAMITRSDVMRINQDQAIHLLAVSVEKRIEVYQNFEWFNFILNLKIGDSVSVEVDETMRRVPAKVSWIGERPEASGIWYNVDFDGNTSQWPSSNQSYSSSHDRLNRQFDTNWNFEMSGSSSVAPSNSRLYYSPNQMHMPMKGGGVSALYDNRRLVQYSGDEEQYRSAPKPAPRERIIPVSRQQPEIEQRNSRSMKPSEPDYNTYSTHPPRPPPSSSMNYPSMSNTHSLQPSRSKSVQTIQRNQFVRQNPAERNERVESDQLNFRIGDQCIWNNNGAEERGIIKYIGFLKGHKTLYAGVEFKNTIGAGTGVFNREQLFLAKDGHAGFVELSSLESPSSSISSTSTSSSQHRRRLSSSRSQQMPAASGTSISVPVNGRHNVNGKQASIESLSDPPPPPYAPPSPPRASSAAAAHQQPPPLPPKPLARVEDFLIDSYDIGSHVVVRHLGAQRTGVVRWLGEEIDDEGDRIVRSAIVQLDEDVPTAWRRSHDASSYTGSPVVGGVLVPIQSLKHNHSGSSSNGASVVQTSTYPTSQTYNNISRRTEDFGSMDSGVEKQKCGIAKDMQQLVGRQKGIQGYCNSCYLDATLYAMFVQTTCFDFLLEKSIKGSETAQQFQKILAHEIVFPLRKVHYVRADHVMKLRKLLAELMPHVTGLTNEEKDPEEILGFIFSKVFHAEPFIKLIGQNHAKDSQYLVPIVVDDWLGGAATSQHLLERHMRSAQVTFAKAPPVLIMQLPRYGQQKVFDKILPLETIDITPFVAGAVPACSKCQACSEVYCPTCFLTRRVFYSEVIFCRKCFHHTHLLPEIEDHKSRDLYPPGKPQKKPHSHKMVLSAVLCIETSHYVAYVRTSSNQWVFFDSMADREGLSDGFNVPVVRECGNMSDWLSLQGWNRLKDADECGQIKAMFGKQSSLDPLVGRLLSDSYICFYEDASPTSSSSSSSTIISSIKNMMN